MSEIDMRYAVDDENSKIVLQVILVFIVVLQILPGCSRFIPDREIIILRHKNLRDVPASKTEIQENIFSQFPEIIHRFVACQHRYPITVLSQDVRVRPEVIFKIPATVIASGGNHCIISFKPFCIRNSRSQFRIDPDPLIRNPGQERGISVAQFDQS